MSVSDAKYDTSMWNPVTFAIYYQRIDIVKLFIEQYVANIILAMRLPPVNEFTEYIVPSQRQNNQWSGSKNQELKFA